MKLRDLSNRFTSFLWMEVSPLPLGLYRILFGIVATLNALYLLPDLEMWFSSVGVTPQTLVGNYFGPARLNLFQWFGDSMSLVVTFFSIHLISAVCILFGLGTRFFAVTYYVTLVSLHHRNPYILHSGDTLLRLMAFWLMFAPCNKALSLDRLIRIFWGTAGAREWEPIRPFASRVMQMQLCVLYFVTCYLKTQGPTWVAGSAVFRVLQLEQMRRFPIPDFFGSVFMSKMMTWGTLAIEGTFPFLIWFEETRFIALAAAVSLHVGLEYTMNIQLFQFIITGVLVLFLTENEIKRAFAWARNRIFGKFEPLDSFYDGDCGFCQRTVDVLGALDILGLIRWHNSRTSAETRLFRGFSAERAELEVLCYRKKHWLGGYHAMRAIALRLPLLFPFALLGFLPGVPFLGVRVYRLIARNRAALSARIPNADVCPPPQKKSATRG